MARASIELIQALELTADRIENGDKYMWGHMGACNCGHLAQTITYLTSAEIHDYALDRYGDWTEQTFDFCPTSGHRFDAIINFLLDAGLTLSDLRHLEKLNNHTILKNIPPERRPLKHNNAADAILYIRTWARLLRAALPEADLQELDAPLEIAAKAEKLPLEAQ
jgi:hypothetical protein